ncbi:hypothetical protein GCM10025868_05980 [Angustibacter aerolatus]|uniref:SAF domain-containing protein n=1 Tax=Angustibacter aerolatus TaxID=1162965 RepID=A0ABQ6JAZ6_9ACTN|nr:hypothetical protein [Angustibacter aerolatus]GMA85348.1 hypothetical protein GCM10025868_05980 [Angustibacter aerolatus]
MRLSLLRRRAARPDVAGVVGTARVDARTKDLTKRLQPGDVAVIDHLDIDTVAAEALVAKRPGAVVNAAPSTSGRYPNLGPGILLAAGVPLVDGVGRDVMVRVAEGERVRVDEGRVYLGDDLEEQVAEGTRQTDATVAVAMEEARAGLSTQAGGVRGEHHGLPAPRARACCSTASACPTSSRGWTAARCSWWSAGTTTARTCTRCAPTCASTSR